MWSLRTDGMGGAAAKRFLVPDPTSPGARRKPQERLCASSRVRASFRFNKHLQWLSGIISASRFGKHLQGLSGVVAVNGGLGSPLISSAALSPLGRAETSKVIYAKRYPVYVSRTTNFEEAVAAYQSAAFSDGEATRASLTAA